MKNATRWIIYAALVILIGWDIFVAIEPTPGDTISAVLLGWASKNPTILLGVGFLLGHLFWPQRR